MRLGTLGAGEGGIGARGGNKGLLRGSGEMGMGGGLRGGSVLWEGRGCSRVPAGGGGGGIWMGW